MTQPKKSRRGWRFYALLACLGVFLISGVLLARDLTRSAGEKAANQHLAQQVHKAREGTLQRTEPVNQDDPEPELPKYADSGNLIQYDGLWQQNNDMAGWLYIEDTEIDLPVMYTPSNLEFYLHRGFDRRYAASGCLFLGADWRPEAAHGIIYGHNMKNGSMFGNLSKYKDLEYAQSHPVIHFDTLTEEREYAVVAAFYSLVYEVQETGVFRYYQYTDLSSQDRFEEYLRQVRAVSLYDTGVDVQYGDRLITLSTCSYHRDNGRFVVVACEKAPAQEQEDPPEP